MFRGGGREFRLLAVVVMFFGLVDLSRAADVDACDQFDGNGDVDLVDFAGFQVHFTGPGPSVAIVPPDPPVSEIMGDWDMDGDVDYQDSVEFGRLLKLPAISKSGERSLR